MRQVFRTAGQLTCFDISKNMLRRTRDAVGEDTCAGGGKVLLFAHRSFYTPIIMFVEILSSPARRPMVTLSLPPWGVFLTEDGNPDNVKCFAL